MPDTDNNSSTKLLKPVLFAKGGFNVANKFVNFAYERCFAGFRLMIGQLNSCAYAQEFDV